MNYLEAEDDGHGPVPRSRNDEGQERRQRQEGLWKRKNWQTIWESTTKVMCTTRGTITVKAVRKEEKEERKANERDKDKTRNQLQIPVSKATAEHVENEDTR